MYLPKSYRAQLIPRAVTRIIPSMAPQPKPSNSAHTIKPSTTPKLPETLANFGGPALKHGTPAMAVLEDFRKQPFNAI